MQKITPCLWLDGNAEEAVLFYISIFKNAEIVSRSYYTDAGPLPAGTLLTAVFRLDGQEFMILNAHPAFQFTEAISFSVSCENQEEVDHYWNSLSAGGEIQMCGWLKDKFGISWQIVPRIMSELILDNDKAKVNRVMTAMMQMRKLDIAKLEEAARG